MLLLQTSLLTRASEHPAGWKDAMKRAAEIFEWLSQADLKPQGAPLHLLAAASYQLADYPAMAVGHLRRIPEEPFSAVLRDLLRGHFGAALMSTRAFWQRYHEFPVNDRTTQPDLTESTFRHIIMCLGTVCDYMRTGQDDMVERALIKLQNLTLGLVHSRDSYSYVLAVVTAGACRRFVETSLWPHIARLGRGSSDEVIAALTQFARSAFLNNRALVWPAQAAGIERLSNPSSFVLCTPTGSGKTTVATLAVLQALFSSSTEPISQEGEAPLGNLALYLVPSRALAAEVEGRLAQDLVGIAAKPITVTGLYGGIDWGPTDAWIQSDAATIVICTFEKADALLRYLGVLFLDRVRLVVIDEAHMVEESRARFEDAEDGYSRAFRLEQLGARLLRAQSDYGFRILALSAVAARVAPALARWINGSGDATPTSSSHRSTRQMLGRLEVNARGQYTIRYDLMDGQSLRFDDETTRDTPYVRNPFPQLPGGLEQEQGVEVQMRAPTFWAALHLAAERPDGSRPSVLISLTQSIGPFAKTCAELIENWSETLLPNYRHIDHTDELWIRCLASAADYFTPESVEYRLLRRGIAVHHGKLPGLLARRLKTLIDRGDVRVIIATSTLSEGVNIPVNHLLVPSVYRSTHVLSAQEFSNLMGRAGRPGVATEGSVLVVLPEGVSARAGRLQSRQWRGYRQLLQEIQSLTEAGSDGASADRASSPLALLLRALENAWRDISTDPGDLGFLAWLEETAMASGTTGHSAAHGYLDTLDAFLIAAVEEVEELRRGELAPNELETELVAIWRRTYAYAAAQEETRLAAFWLARGRVIKVHYPDATLRRRIYRSSLSPRSAMSLLDIVPVLRAHLQTGSRYHEWEVHERLAFIRETINILSRVQSFQIGAALGRKKHFRDWPKLLQWWLAKTTLDEQPKAHEITNWYHFVSQNFIYRATWGIGSFLGVLLDEDEVGLPIKALHIGDWPKSGLPWIAFWLKELITWGTLDPVAAFLLARGDAVDRPQAEAEAREYFEAVGDGTDPNDVLDPRTIGSWVDARRARQDRRLRPLELAIESELLAPQGRFTKNRLSVSPLNVHGSLLWVDAAGYAVARSNAPIERSEALSTFEFELDVRDSTIAGKPYLLYG
ncbi:MAG: DEAD/DEAH box helicase [Gemmatimonadaceae bacterium]